MKTVAFDGNSTNGSYRVDCECGTNWSGQAEPAGVRSWSPALPVAECVVHMRLAHQSELPIIRFTTRFNDWHQQYWEHVKRSRSTGLEYSSRNLLL